MKLRQLCYLSEKGKREQQDDSTWPEQDGNGIDLNLFLVCDGVGGSAHGDLASKITCQQIVVYHNSLPSGINDQQTLSDAVAFAQHQLALFAGENSLSVAMSTTLVLLNIGEGWALAGHVGDSRIYQVRNSQIIFRTQDHSLVNRLVKSGMITEEDALEHPERNVITRSISARNTLIRPDSSMLDVEHGDIFLLCTDGILEGIDEEYMINNFHPDADLQAVMEEIDTRCAAHANDNYSAFLIQID